MHFMTAWACTLQAWCLTTGSVVTPICSLVWADHPIANWAYFIAYRHAFSLVSCTVTQRWTAAGLCIELCGFQNCPSSNVWNVILSWIQAYTLDEKLPELATTTLILEMLPSRRPAARCYRSEVKYANVTKTPPLSLQLKSAALLLLLKSPSFSDALSLNELVLIEEQ